MTFKKIMASALTAGLMLSFIPATAMAATKGWVETGDGWRYYTSDSAYLKDTWKEIDGSWYYFFEDGTMACDNWVFISGKLYHFDSRGHMEKNKWVESESDRVYYDQINGETIYLTSEWRFVGSDGSAYSGWKKIGGSWYYFSENNTGYNPDFGLMSTGVRRINNKVYCFDTNGKMKSNCWAKTHFGEWYYFGSDGKAVTGWKQINGKWYLFDDYAGAMLTGAQRTWGSDGPTCWMLEEDGTLTSKTGWVQREKYEQDYWYYVKSGGKCFFDEWANLNGKWYYFDFDGKMVTDKSDFLIHGKLYDFASSGACKNPNSGRAVKGWKEVYDEWNRNSYWTYGDKDGNICYGQWIKRSGNSYYIDYDGHMQHDTVSRLIDGKIYSFDSDGKAKDLAGNKKGWITIGEGKAYIGSDGKAYSGWNKISGKWYFFDTYNGFAATGSWGVDGIDYYFKDNGEMVTGWYENYGSWMYADSSGKLYMDRWLNYKGSWYYFYGWSSMNSDQTFIIDGSGYDFDKDGKCLNPDKPRAVVV